jgi:hypothetical protein
VIATAARRHRTTVAPPTATPTSRPCRTPTSWDRPGRGVDEMHAAARRAAAQRAGVSMSPQRCGCRRQAWCRLAWIRAAQALVPLCHKSSSEGRPARDAPGTRKRRGRCGRFSVPALGWSFVGTGLWRTGHPDRVDGRVAVARPARGDLPAGQRAAAIVLGVGSMRCSGIRHGGDGVGAGGGPTPVAARATTVSAAARCPCSLACRSARRARTAPWAADGAAVLGGAGGSGLAVTSPERAAARVPNRSFRQTSRRSGSDKAQPRASNNARAVARKGAESSR